MTDRLLSDWFEGIMMLTLTAFVAIFVIVGGLAMYQIFQTYKHCARWGTKTEWQEAYTSYMWAGKVMMSQYHPAQWVTNSVCVEPMGE